MDGLTIDEVMDIVLESRNLLMKEYPVKCSIVVCSCPVLSLNKILWCTCPFTHK